MLPPLARGLAVFPLLILFPLLTSCVSTQAAVLDVDSSSLLLDSQAPVREIVISNSGSPRSVLAWHAEFDSPLLRLSPSSGEVRAGGAPQTIRVSVDFSTLEAGSVAAASVRFESNGGNSNLDVQFHMSGTRACDSPHEPDLSATTQQSVAGSFVPGELLIGYQDSVGLIDPLGEPAFRPLAAAIRADHGLELLGASATAGFERVAVDDPLEAAARLAQDDRIAFAHPNYYVTPLALPNDPCYYDQWPLQGFGVPEAWELASDARVVVAVIDTGVDIDHEDLRSKVLAGYDLWDDDDDPRPGGPEKGSAHGTHVAGIALAQGDNGVGVAGVAHGPQILLLPIKIFDDSGVFATTAGLADAILWAAGVPVAGLPRNENPAQIINISLGAGPNRLAAVDAAAERARNAGAIIFAAAGNNGSTDGRFGVQSPANAPAVIAVGSVNQDSERSAFSDWGRDGTSVDLMAPGGYGTSECRRVRSTMPWSDYGCMAGTSMAAPFAAGVAALILSREPGLTPAEVTSRMSRTAYFDPRTMNRAEYGAGVICADRAVAGTPVARPLPCGSP